MREGRTNNQDIYIATTASRANGHTSTCNMHTVMRTHEHRHKHKARAQDIVHRA